MKRIAMIIPYFGKFPEWMNLYLYSCSYQEMIDFYYYTDCEKPETVYKNTIFIQISFEKYCQMISSRLGINYNPSNPYKLCDLRPFYGYIHQNLLQKYDFWGYGDIDLVYGDLSPLINEVNLRKYNILTSHSYRFAGHLTICRNSQFYNELCFKYTSWKEMLTDSKFYGFDEIGWARMVYPQFAWINRLYKYIFKNLAVGYFEYLTVANKLFCNRWTKRHMKEYYTTPHVEPKEGIIPEWIYDPQTHKISSPDDKSLIYLHFLFFKKTPFLNTDYHWKGDYYKIGKIADYSKCGQIKFNYKELAFKN